jgi:hypothetical protein
MSGWSRGYKLIGKHDLVVKQRHNKQTNMHTGVSRRACLKRSSVERHQTPVRMRAQNCML